MKYKLAGFILIASACSAIAQDTSQMTALGFEIGKPLDLPVCQYTAGTTAVGIQQRTCIEPANERLQHHARVHFGLKEIPPIVKGLSITVDLVDDKLEALYFAAPGLNGKERTLRLFTEKYGTPTTLTRASLQGADGARYDTFTAVWDLPTLYVAYTPTSGNVNEGSARIETQRARQARASDRP